MNKKKYKAQALAIAMIVLVVCSIVGISIYSRVTKDKTLTVEEQASSEALEIADLMIDYLIQVPISEVVDNFPGDTLTSGTTTTIAEYLTVLDVNPEALTSGICDPGENGNEHYLKVQEADENSFFEIRPGQVKSFVVKDLTLNPGCTVTIGLNVRGENQVGFDITKIYSDNDGKIKEYEYTDSTQYCFSSDTLNCNNINFIGDAWIKFSPENTLDIDLTETVDAGGVTYTLNEVRIKAVGGTVAVSQNIDEVACGEGNADDLRMIEITAGANCNGVYRAKQILIPETKWHSTIFDYVIFNGQGSI